MALEWAILGLEQHNVDRLGIAAHLRQIDEANKRARDLAREVWRGMGENQQSTALMNIAMDARVEELLAEALRVNEELIDKATTIIVAIRH